MTDSLAAALDALADVAEHAGVDPATARREGEALAATVSEPSKGSFVDWSEQTGRARSAEDFFDAASRGRRYRSAPTATMSLLAAQGSTQAPAYAAALGDVALAAATLGDPDPRAAGNAHLAAAAQLREPAPRQVAPTVGDEVASSLLQQLSVVQRKLAGLQAGNAPLVEPVETSPDQPSVEPVETLPDGSRQARPTGQPAPPPEEPEEQPEEETPAKSVEELLAELDELVGLAGVKEEIHKQAAVLRIEGLRKDAGLGSPAITRHLVFNGNPGTGKTTVARLVAGIYKALGLLSKGQLVEVDRSELVAGYLGQTAAKTAEVVKSAIGGVLFIDEAYSLSGDQYGTEAINTLVKEMEDHRDDLVVIVAGYPGPMAVFVAQNPGLESRFRTHLDFPDYSDDELVEIFRLMASGAEYDAGDDVTKRLRDVLLTTPRGESFGNARHVRNLLEAAIGRHAWRLREVDEPTVEQLRTLEPDDLDEPAELTPPDQQVEPGVVDVVEVGDSSPADPAAPEEAT
jgi:hypothetical protein